MDNYYAMILAGGGGTRLWPMSRRTKPKQLLPLVDNQTMFRTSVERLLPLFPPERIYVVTGQRFVTEMQADVPEIPTENFVLEPYARDNFAAVGLGLAVIHHRDPQAIVAMLTADHHIARRDAFIRVLSAAYDLAQTNRIVTLGISPSFPSTGFGYIRQGAALGEVRGFQPYEAVEFTEKPNAVTATSFLASGEYSWNSGMFIWKTEIALGEIQRHQPAAAGLLSRLIPVVDSRGYETVLREIWSQMPKDSIDFAIMEKAKNMAIIPVDIGWSDVGSWSSLFDVLTQDKFGNCFGTKASNHVILETNSSLVFTDRLTVTIGVKDLIVVSTDDVLFICHRDRAQEVREVVRHLRDTGQDEYL